MSEHVLRDLNRKDVCASCRFYSPARPFREDETPHGDCRRHAPVREGAFARWPVVGAKYWCGDFTAAVDRLADPEVRS